MTSADRMQIVTPASHILGLLNIMTALDTGAWIRLHPRFDIDTMLHHIEADRITIEMAVAPIALALAVPPAPGELRPVVAALHHVVRDAGDAERRRDCDRQDGRGLADRLRDKRIAGHRLQSARRRAARHCRSPGAGRDAVTAIWRDDRRDPGAVGIADGRVPAARRQRRRVLRRLVPHRRRGRPRRRRVICASPTGRRR